MRNAKVRRNALEARKTVTIIACSLAVFAGAVILVEALMPPSGGASVSLDIEARRTDRWLIFFVRHAGGDSIRLDPLGSGVRGYVWLNGRRVEMQDWLFKRPHLFAEGDIAWARAATGTGNWENVRIEIWMGRAGKVFEGTVTVR